MEEKPLSKLAENDWRAIEKVIELGLQDYRHFVQLATALMAAQKQSDNFVSLAQISEHLSSGGRAHGLADESYYVYRMQQYFNDKTKIYQVIDNGQDEYAFAMA